MPAERLVSSSSSTLHLAICTLQRTAGKRWLAKAHHSSREASCTFPPRNWSPSLSNCTGAGCEGNSLSPTSGWGSGTPPPAAEERSGSMPWASPRFGRHFAKESRPRTAMGSFEPRSPLGETRKIRRVRVLESLLPPGRVPGPVGSGKADPLSAGEVGSTAACGGCVPCTLGWRQKEETTKGW